MWYNSEIECLKKLSVPPARPCPQIEIHCKNKRYLGCSDPKNNLAGVICESSIYFLFTQLQEIFVFTQRQTGIGGKQKEREERTKFCDCKVVLKENKNPNKMSTP